MQVCLERSEAAKRVASDTDNPPIILLLFALLHALLRAVDRAVNSALQYEVK